MLVTICDSKYIHIYIYISFYFYILVWLLYQCKNYLKVFVNKVSLINKVIIIWKFKNFKTISIKVLFIMIKTFKIFQKIIVFKYVIKNITLTYQRSLFYYVIIYYNI